MQPRKAEPGVGLCSVCEHVRRVANRRGSAFYLCGKAAKDSRLPRYPRLPVLTCPGYAPQAHGQDPPPEKA